MTKNGLRKTVRLLDEISRLGLAGTKAVVGCVRGNQVDDTGCEGNPWRKGELEQEVGNGKALRLGRVRLGREAFPEGEAWVVERERHRC